MRSFWGVLALLSCGCSGAVEDDVATTPRSTEAPSRAPRRGDRQRIDLDLLQPSPANGPWLPRELAGARFLRGGVARSRIEQDLELVLGAGNGQTYDDDDGPKLQLHVFNRSEHRSYPIVLSGDGSEMGWREPELRVNVEMRVGDAWKAAPAFPSARCGNFDEEWEKDVRILAPGESANLEWIHMPNVDLYGAEEIRLTAIYNYGAGESTRRWGATATVPDVLADTPRFRLTSRPVTLRPVRAMRLDVTPIDITRLEPNTPMERSFRASLENLTGVAQTFDSGGLYLELVAKRADSLDRETDHTVLDLSESPSTDLSRNSRNSTALEPARSLSVTANRVVPARDFGLDWSEVERWRATYQVSIRRSEDLDARTRDISSDWFDLRGRRIDPMSIRGESPSKGSP